MLGHELQARFADLDGGAEAAAAALHPARAQAALSGGTAGAGGGGGSGGVLEVAEAGVDRPGRRGGLAGGGGLPGRLGRQRWRRGQRRCRLAAAARVAARVAPAVARLRRQRAWRLRWHRRWRRLGWQRAWRLGRHRVAPAARAAAPVAAADAAVPARAVARRAVAPGPEPFVFGVPPAAAAHFKKGINLGNRLEAPNEGDWGGVIQAEDFPFIARRGFDHVRIPIRFSGHAPAASPYTIDAAFFSRVDTVLNQATAANLAVVVDMHAYDELAADVAAHRDRFVGALDADCGPLPESPGHGRVRAPQRTQRPARHDLE